MSDMVELQKTRNIGIMAHIDAGKPPPRSGCCFILVKFIALGKLIKVLLPWNGWIKNRKEA